jgi:hypothetical protein
VTPTKRTTVCFSPKLYRALKVKAATTDRGFSELVNESVLLALREDAFDEEAFCRSRNEPSRAFSEALSDLKRARHL